MCNKDMISLLNLHKASHVMVIYGKDLYPVNNLFMEYGVLYLRSLKLLTDDEKAECDVVYGEEDEKMTGEELIDELTKYDEDVQVKLNLPDGNFDCYFCYSKENNIIELNSKGR